MLFQCLFSTNPVQSEIFFVLFLEKNRMIDGQAPSCFLYNFTLGFIWYLLVILFNAKKLGVLSLILLLLFHVLLAQI